MRLCQNDSFFLLFCRLFSNIDSQAFVVILYMSSRHLGFISAAMELKQPIKFNQLRRFDDEVRYEQFIL